MDRDIKRRDVLKGVGAAGLTTLAGCTGGGGGDKTTKTTKTTAKGEQKRTAKMGILMGVTGALASLGPPIRDGGELPFKTLEGEDLPVKLDYQFEDTATDPQQGISSAKALVNAGYPSVNGALSSTVTAQVAKQVLIPNQVVGCSPASTSLAITSLKDNDFIWRTAPSDALQGKALAQVALEKANADSASTLYLNNAYGQLLSKNFADAYKKRGGQILHQVSFEKGQSSYTSRINNALNDDPETLLIIGYPASGVQLLRDYYSESDKNIPLLVPDGLQDPTLPSKVGKDLSNVMGTAPTAAGPAEKDFKNQWKNVYGGAPGVYSAQAYDSTAVQLLANVAAGKNAGPAIRDQMRKVANPGGTEVTPANLAEGIRMVANGEDVNYQGASSTVNFDDKGDIKGAAYSVWGWEKTDGEYKIVVKDTISFSP